MTDGYKLIKVDETTSKIEGEEYIVTHSVGLKGLSKFILKNMIKGDQNKNMGYD